MLKIGEFSKLTKVSVRMLHYYDSVGLLEPMKTDKITGYRLYSVSQVPILQKIIMLRDFNFQVIEIEDALKNWSDDVLTTKLRLKINEIQNIISQERKQIKNIELAIQSIEKQELDIHYNIIVKKIPAKTVLSLRKTILNYNDEGILWEEVFQYIRKYHVDILKRNDNNIAIYHDVDHKDTNVDVEVCVPVNSIRNCIEPFQFKQLTEVETMACMMVSGSYLNLSSAYQSFMYWLEEHPQYEMDGLTRQICHRDHTNEEFEEDFLTEIQIPITIKKDN
ncbi:MAG: MerR family transcriptional regulator [Bacilli bacterium]